MKTKPKLTEPQERVMKWLYGGWSAWAQGGVVTINGERIGNLSTLKALINRKLIVKDGNEYKAKRCPICNRPRPLTEAGCCNNCYP